MACAVKLLPPHGSPDQTTLPQCKYHQQTDTGRTNLLAGKQLLVILLMLGGLCLDT